MEGTRILVERVTQLCVERHISINAFELESGVGRGNVKRWADNSPSVDKLIKTANYFSVSTDYLLGKTNNPTTNYSDEVTQLVDSYSNAPDSLKAAAVAVLKSGEASQKS